MFAAFINGYQRSASDYWNARKVSGACRETLISVYPRSLSASRKDAMIFMMMSCGFPIALRLAP
jgi:hypothetical protein